MIKKIKNKIQNSKKHIHLVVKKTKKYKYHFIIIIFVFIFSFIFYTLPNRTKALEEIQFDWAKKYGTSANDRGAVLEVTNDFVYNAGEFTGTNVDFGSGYSLTSLGSSDVYLSKSSRINPGTTQWAISLGGSNADTVSDIKMSPYGDYLYVIGTFKGTMTLGSYSLTSEGLEDIFITKINSTNGTVSWAKRIGGVGEDFSYSIDIITEGSNELALYIVGQFGPDINGSCSNQGVDFNPDPNLEFRISCQGEEDAFISKYTKEGNFVWAKSIGGPNTQTIYDVSVDSSGIYFTGSFKGTGIDFNPGAEVYPLTSANNVTPFLAKYDPAGNFSYAHKYQATSFSYARSLAINSNYIYLFGDFTNSITINNTTLSAVGSGDIFMAKLNKVNPTSNDYLAYDINSGTGNGNYLGVRQVEIDGANNLYYGGYFGGQVDFDPTNSTYNLNSDTGTQGFYSKLDSNFNFLYAKIIYDDNVQSQSSVFHIHPYANEIFVTGNFMGSPDFDPDPNTEYILSTNGQADAFLMNLGTTQTVPLISISANPQQINENSQSTALQFVVTSSVAASSPIHVTLNYSGSATGGVDYTTPPVDVYIQGGQTQGFANFNVINDSRHELNETIVAEINTVSGGPLAEEDGEQVDTITILNDDPVPTVNFSAEPFGIAESQTTAPLKFKVQLSNLSYQDITASFIYGGDAIKDVDYKKPGGGQLPITETFTFPALDSNTVRYSTIFNVVNDSSQEPNETILTDNRQVTNALLGTSGTMTIYDYDIPIPSVSLFFYPSVNINTPNTYQMTWTIEGTADSCMASSNPNNTDWSGPVNTGIGGSKTVNNVTQNTTFTIICSNQNGSSQPDSVSIIVDKIPVNLSSTAQWKRGPLKVGGLKVDTSSSFEDGIRIDTQDEAIDKVLSSVGTPSNPIANWVYLNNNNQYLDPWVRNSSSSLVRLHANSANDNIILQNGTVIYKTDEAITESNKEQNKFIHETGTGNLFFGLGSGRLTGSVPSNTTGVGYKAFSSLANGMNNTALGSNSGKSITGVDQNTLLGYKVHESYVNGNLSVSIGKEAGNCSNCIQNVKNISIGALSGPLNSSINESVSIGYNAHANINNSMMFGNSSVLGWGFATPPGGYAIKVGFTGGNNGSGAYLTKEGEWGGPSDRTFKHDITEISYGLEEVLNLHPVDFKWNHNNQKDFGFVAQEVKKIIPEIVSGIEGDMGISYGKISPVLTKALQEQQIIIDNYKERIKLLKNRIEILENK